MKYNKKELVKLIREGKVSEFVDDDGNIISDKMPINNDSVVKSDVTSDKLVDLARQKYSWKSPMGAMGGLSFGMVYENEGTMLDSLPSSVINSLSNFIDSINQNPISDENKVVLADFIKNKLNGE